MLGRLYWGLVEDPDTPGLPLLWMAILLVAVSVGFPWLSSAGLAKYAAGFVLIPRLLNIDRTRVNWNLLLWLLVPFFLLFFNAFMSGVLNARPQSYKEAFFFLNIIMFCLGIADVRFRPEFLQRIFFLFVLFWFFYLLQYKGFLLSFTNSDESSVAEKATTSYLFSVIIIYLVGRNSFHHVAYSALGLGMTMKRATLPALALGIAVAKLLPRSVVSSKAILFSAVVVGNWVLFWAIGELYSGEYDYFFLANFDKTTNHFFMGRPYFHNALSWIEWPLINFDYAWTYAYLADTPLGYEIWGGQDVRLHNDVYRCIVEIGIFQTVLIFGAFYMAVFSLQKNRHIGLALVVMLNVLAYFDNVLIYTEYLLMLIIVLIRLANDELGQGQGIKDSQPGERFQ